MTTVVSAAIVDSGADVTRIEGRDIDGDPWEASDPVPGSELAERGEVALVVMPETGGALDATAALHLGAFLLARGLGAGEGQAAILPSEDDLARELWLHTGDRRVSFDAAHYSAQDAHRSAARAILARIVARFRVVPESAPDLRTGRDYVER